MKEFIYPPFLQEGDKVVIVSPSGKIDKKLLDDAKKNLESWGLKVSVAKHAKEASGSFAGSIRQRQKDFQEAMDDEKAKVIFCSRGGYGVVHFMDKLDFTRFHEHPKWLVGYSDISALHNLFQSEGYVSLHAPMARHLVMEEADDPCTLHLKNILFGQIPEYSCEKHKLNRKGTATGTLRGGNLAVLYGLRATPYDLLWDNVILFLEDIGERPHAIERMLYNLKLSGVLENLSGLIIGQFTEYDEKESLLKKELYHSIYDLVKEYDYPVCFNFPVGHVTHNLPLICGSKVELSINKSVILKPLTQSAQPDE